MHMECLTNFRIFFEQSSQHDSPLSPLRRKITERSSNAFVKAPINYFAELWRLYFNETSPKTMTAASIVPENAISFDIICPILRDPPILVPYRFD